MDLCAIQQLMLREKDGCEGAELVDSHIRFGYEGPVRPGFLMLIACLLSTKIWTGSRGIEIGFLGLV